MFSRCSSMKWAHLPNAGGIYAQDPELLRKWDIIWGLASARERAEEAKRKSESRRKSS